MKKCLHTALLALFLAGLTSPYAAAEELEIVGTGSGSAVLKAIGEALTAVNPGVTVAVPKSIGSGGAIREVGSGNNVLGRVARTIKEKEKGYGLSYLPYAKNPIVFFVNPSVTVTNLTPEQACGIYSGAITNWSEVGGQDAKIRVIRREDGDSSLEVLVETVPGFKDITLTDKSKTTLSDPETIEFAESKADTIAFGTYANARNAKVKILTISGQAPTDPAYPYVGTLALVFKEANRQGTVAKFLDFIVSPAALEPIRSAGAMPL